MSKSMHAAVDDGRTSVESASASAAVKARLGAALGEAQRPPEPARLLEVDARSRRRPPAR